MDLVDVLRMLGIGVVAGGFVLTALIIVSFWISGHLRRR